MRLVIDIEANGLNEITLGSKGQPVKEGNIIWCVVCVDIDTDKMYSFTPFNLKECKALLEKATLIVGHNILSFDIIMLQRILGISFKCDYWDTLVVSKIMYPDINNHPLGDNSLESWGRYLNNPKQNYTGGWENFSDEMLQYCQQDVRLGKEIYLRQKIWVEEKKYQNIVLFEHMVSKILMEQTNNGFNFDLTNGYELHNKLLMEKVGIEDQMRKIFPDKIHYRKSEKTGKDLKPKIEVFNPGSRQQIAQRLEEKYGWKAPLTDKGNPKIDESVLADLEFPEAKALLEYFACIKLIGQVEDWITRAEASRDKKIHGFVNAQGAATGRCTHSQPNVAQVSGDHRARELWLPDTNEVLVGCDLSGLELRMLAHYMHKYDKGAYGNIILNGDIHVHNQQAAGLPTRNNAKVFIYGFLYGAGDAKIGKIVNASAKEGSKLREKFLKEIPALAKVQQEAKFQAAKWGAVVLPDMRMVPVRSEHAALNTWLQGSGAIVSKYWMVLANRNLKKKFGNKVKQVAYVHDELQFTCPKDIADEAGQIIKAAATEAGERLDIRMRIDAEYKIGTNWSETH